MTGTWTILAPSRAGRPKDSSCAPQERADASDCPFCPGREHQTPPAVWQAALPDDGEWTVRVFGNRFPALEAPQDSDGADEVDAPAPYRALEGIGAHEVIVETPRHGEGLADYSPEHLALLVDAYADRLGHWRRDLRVAAAVLFRNWGRVAGASLCHAHTQLVGMPRVPDAVVRELGNFSQAFSGSQRCPLCEAADADDEGGRAVWSDGVTTVHSPFAAPVPYFMRIVPRACAFTLAEATADERASFGLAMGAAARALRGEFGDVGFNIVIRTAPYTAHRAQGLPFHWHADVVPRASDQAGFEWGTGTHLNVIDPDAAAMTLRAGLERDTTGV